MRNIFGIRAFRVGGLHFLKVGRLTFMVCRSRKPAPKLASRGAGNPAVRILSPAAPFRLSSDGLLVLGYADET
jgi:hypothetical protein